MRNRSAKRTNLSTRPSMLAGVFAFTLLAPGAAHAHFLWLTCQREQGKPVIRAFLSETPSPDGPEFLGRIAQARITGSGRVLGWTRDKDTYRVKLPEPCPGVIDGFCDLGVMKRNGTAFLLVYTARVQFGPSAPEAAEISDDLRVRLVARAGQAPIVVVNFRGKPAPGAVVKVYPEDGRASGSSRRMHRAGWSIPLPLKDGPVSWSSGRKEKPASAKESITTRSAITPRSPWLRPSRPGRERPTPPHRRLRSPCFPRQSTVSAAPCWVIGSTSTEGTPARRTATAVRPWPNTSGG